KATRISGPPISPAWMMWDEFSKARRASGRSRPCVSEITPISSPLRFALRMGLLFLILLFCSFLSLFDGLPDIFVGDMRIDLYMRVHCSNARNRPRKLNRMVRFVLPDDFSFQCNGSVVCAHINLGRG